MSGRVRIGTCSDPTDGAFVRSMFAARGIPVVIGAEHHASLLGPIGSAFLSLDIWVDADDAEDAAELLRDLREGKLEDAQVPADGMPDPDDVDADDGAWVARRPAGADAALAAGAHDRDDDDAQVAELRARVYRRRRAVVAVISGVFLTFGTAHMFTGAWLRGIALAGLEVLGILHIGTGDRLGIAAVAAAIGFDVGATLWRLLGESRARAAAEDLPAARVRDP